MAFSLSNIFKPKVTIDPSLVLNQIDYKEGTKFAETNTHKVYIDIEELGGFPYLKTVIFGVGGIKIKRVGCSISFVFKDEKITLASDNTDIESQELGKTGIFHTPIDFELEESDVEKIKQNKVLEVIYTFKKNTLSFKPA
jgi:hypothetical protein